MQVCLTNLRPSSQLKAFCSAESDFEFFSFLNYGSFMFTIVHIFRIHPKFDHIDEKVIVFIIIIFFFFLSRKACYITCIPHIVLQIIDVEGLFGVFIGDCIDKNFSTEDFPRDLIFANIMEENCWIDTIFDCILSAIALFLL